MPVQAPLDVDLEDRLIYGLTPTRFGYLAAGGMAALATWSSHWLPLLLRMPLAVLLAGAGVAFAWGRYRGRPLDAWLGDALRFGLANYRLEVDRRLRARLAALPSPRPRLRRRERPRVRLAGPPPEWIDAYCSPGLDQPP